MKAETAAATALAFIVSCDNFCASHGAVPLSPASSSSSSMSSAGSIIGHRNGPYPQFFSYQPRTDVADHAAIDRDQKAITVGLMKHSQQGFEAAQRVYEQGAHSSSYAFLQLDKPVSEAIPHDTTIIGSSYNKKMVLGRTIGDVRQGEDVLSFLYEHHTHSLKAANRDMECHVGGSNRPNLKGCLASSGVLKIGDYVSGFTSLPYTYDPMTDNRNGRTFEMFSTEAGYKIFKCMSGDCHRDNDFSQQFHDYYGKSSYSDEWIRAALHGQETTFKRGNSDFSVLPIEGRAEAVRMGTVVMSLWMHMIRVMDYAVNNCVESCTSDDCVTEQVHNWDQAVAYYTGSLEQTSSKGYLLYTVANKMCARFGTCVVDDDHDINITPFANSSSTATADVNRKIFKLFEKGQQQLVEGKCMDARQTKEKVVRLMVVPLVQGLIRSAHSLDVRKDTRTRAIADGAAFAASILPLVHACNPADALTIDQFMNIGRTATTMDSSSSSGVDFEQVKSALERNYECMQITCNDVGGLLQMTGTGYQDRAAPCIDYSNNAASTAAQMQHKKFRTETAILVTFVVLGVFILHLFAIFIYKRRERAKRLLELMEEQTIRSSEYEYGDERSVSSLHVVEFEQSVLSSQLPPIVVTPARGRCSYSPEAAEFTRLWEEEFGEPTTRL